MSVTEVTESVIEAVAEEGAEVDSDVYFSIPANFAGQRILWLPSIPL